MTASQRAEIEGYAAVFGEPDLAGDVVGSNAFARQLIPGRLEGVRMLYQHQAEAPIGRWTSLYEDNTGLVARGEVFLDTRLGRDVYALLSGGAVDGLSIGFKTRKSRPRAGGRLLTEIDLWEISIVTFPMAPRARITRIAPAGERLPRNLLSA
ncbi:MAG: HK97 family phage prohead protease [Parvularcula sp.]|jgi:HK97 family phage prohead protease|nr:HK97 family phage prohead protease [Parvularcula sp.]